MTLTDGVDDLVDHGFAKFKLFLAFAVTRMADVLRYHGDFITALEAFASTSSVGTVLVVLVVVLVKR